MIRETYTTDEVSRLLGYTKENVQHLIRTGKIKATKENRTWKIPAEELERITNIRKEIKDNYYTLDDAAEHIFCTKNKLYQLIKTGEIKDKQINNKRFVSKDEVNRFNKKREEAEEANKTYTVKEASDILGYDVPNLRNYIHMGRINAYKENENGKLFIPVEEVNRILNERKELQKNWVTREQASEIIFYAPDTITKIVKREHMRTKKIGKRVFISLEDIEKFKRDMFIYEAVSASYKEEREKEKND